MTRGMGKWLVLGTFLMATLYAGYGLADSERKNIFYNVTTDDVWTAGMAVGQANKALESGYGVTIFLNVRGVYLGTKSRMRDILGASGKSPQDLLLKAMKGGARVIICPMCMKQAGINKDGLLEGVEIGGPDITFKAMTADDTVVVSY